MKAHKSTSRRIQKLFAILLCLIIPFAAWLCLTSTSIAAPETRGDEQSTNLHNLMLTPTATPTPAPTRTVGWASTQPPGFSGGLPPTSGWAAVGGGGDLCADYGVPPGVHFWLPLGGGPFQVRLVSGDPAYPPTIRILECGGEPDPTTLYTITDPNDKSVSIRTDSSGLTYTLLHGSPLGTYDVEISSPYGPAELAFYASQDTDSHIYVHDAVTGGNIADPNHGIRIDYANFDPGERVTVGLYRVEYPQIHLLDAWQVGMDGTGSYSEILVPPQGQAAQTYVLIACELENCIAENVLWDSSIKLIVSDFLVQPAGNIPLPSDEVKSYYSAINNRQYELSWGMLSDHFKDLFHRRRDGSYDYQGYKDFWDTVASVEILSQNPIRQNTSEAVVVTDLRYNLKNGKIIDDENPRITLGWDEPGARWLFYNKGP